MCQTQTQCKVAPAVEALSVAPSAVSRPSSEKDVASRDASEERTSHVFKITILAPFSSLLACFPRWEGLNSKVRWLGKEGSSNLRDLGSSQCL